jgi:hypothetical protein
VVATWPVALLASAGLAGVEQQGETGVAQSLRADQVLAHVVPCPAGTEGLAARGRLTDQVGEHLVEGASDRPGSVGCECLRALGQDRAVA